jgi:hypothetical protein
MIPMHNADNDDVDVFRAGGWTREQLIEMNRGFVEAMSRAMSTDTAEPSKGTPAGFLGAPRPKNTA